MALGLRGLADAAWVEVARVYDKVGGVAGGQGARFSLMLQPGLWSYPGPLGDPQEHVEHMRAH